MRRTTPTPPDATLQRTIHGLRNEPVTFVENLLAEYGDIVKLPFGECDLYLLNHPDFIRDIFLAERVFAKRRNPDAEHSYLSQISGFAPLFNLDLIPGYAPVFVKAAERVHLRWQVRYAAAGPFEVDMYREIGRITLEVVIQTLFRADAEADAKDLFDAMLTMDSGYGFDPIESTLAGFLPPTGITPPSASTEARAFIQRYVQGLAEKPAEGSYLAMLVEHMCLEKAVETAMFMLFGMHEVTATTLPWAWYRLSEHPEVDQKVSAELSKVLGGQLPQYEDIEGFRETSRMFEEVRRLYPSVWIVGRFVREDYSFDGHTVPAGSIVMASQRVMHRDLRYFSNPQHFDPSRWTPQARAERPTFSYFPFSSGPRACAGEIFAKTQDSLIFATLAPHWKARVVPGQQIASVPQKSDAPRPGIRMTLEVRK